MNIYFIIAGCYLLICFLIHALIGDKEYRKIRPSSQEKSFQIWLMGRGTFQMVGVDLLLTAIFLILMGTRIVPYHFSMGLFITLLYFGYLVFWIGTLIVSKAKPFQYLKLGQWIIFVIVFVLMLLGMR